MMWDADVSFGGFKQSGWGYENGELGLDGYQRSKSVWTMV
jgi:aldehyde dehydrogenase (NAD+)